MLPTVVVVAAVVVIVATNVVAIFLIAVAMEDYVAVGSSVGIERVFFLEGCS